MKDRIILFIKGICMGFADVIPGVSGGTLALVLGIYKEFVDTLRGLNLSWVPLLMAWIKSGRQESEKVELMEALRALNLPFLVTLGAGIVTALLLGTLFIPYLIENHPVPTKAFFLGLIVASVYIPLRMIRQEGSGSKHWGVALVMILLGTGLGWVLTNPASKYDVATSQFEAVSQGETLKDLARQNPTSSTAEQIYWSEQNEALRAAVQGESPEIAAKLMALHESQKGVQAVGKKELKARALPYHEVPVPKATKVVMSRPALWFVFIAGAVAICAMILPGISGSYILLIFGVYFFILNCVKGMLSLLAKGQIPSDHIIYVTVFVLALVIGILSFARLLSYLLARHAAPTLGVLVGLMIGCLRGIWPFQTINAGVPVNIFPGSQFPELGVALITMILGFLLVVGLTVLGSKFDSESQAVTEA